MAMSQGLRIEGKKPDEALAAEEVKESGQTAAGDAAKDTAALTFSGVLRSRLENAAKADEESAALLADQLNQVAKHISENLGLTAAVSFQNYVLNATAKKVNEGALSSAVGFFFSSLSSKDAEKVDFETQVGKMVQYLNEGEGSSGRDEVSSLKEAMNSYFGSMTVGRADKKFNESFSWVDETVASADGAAEDSDKFLVLKMGNSETAKSGAMDLPQEGPLKAVEWLRQTPEYENAAQYLEENYQSDPGLAVATTVAILARENDLESAYGFVQYLNQNVADQVGSGDREFAGWNLGLDYPTFVPEDQLADAPAEGLLAGGYWLGDNEADEAPSQIKRLGLTANYRAADAATGAWHAVPVSYDLDELFESYSAAKTPKSVDVYV
jgi:hypothetical protein